MARQQPIELFMPPNMLKAKVGGTLRRHRHGRDQARRSGDGRTEKRIRRLGRGRCRQLVAAREPSPQTPDAASPRRPAARRP